MIRRPPEVRDRISAMSFARLLLQVTSAVVLRVRTWFICQIEGDGKTGFKTGKRTFFVYSNFFLLLFYTNFHTMRGKIEIEKKTFFFNPLFLPLFSLSYPSL